MLRLIIDLVLLGAAISFWALWQINKRSYKLAVERYLSRQTELDDLIKKFGDEMQGTHTALRWYANADNWRNIQARAHSLAFRDKGYIARAALHGDSVDEAIRHLEPKPAVVRGGAQDAPSAPVDAKDPPNDAQNGENASQNAGFDAPVGAPEITSAYPDAPTASEVQRFDDHYDVRTLADSGPVFVSVNSNNQTADASSVSHEQAEQ